MKSGQNRYAQHVFSDAAGSLNSSQGQILLLERILGNCHEHIFTAVAQRRISDLLFKPLLLLLVSLAHKVSKWKCHIVDFQTTRSLNDRRDPSYGFFFQPHTNREPQAKQPGGFPLGRLQLSDQPPQAAKSSASAAHFPGTKSWIKGHSVIRGATPLRKTKSDCAL